MSDGGFTTVLRINATVDAFLPCISVMLMLQLDTLFHNAINRLDSRDSVAKCRQPLCFCHNALLHALGRRSQPCRRTWLATPGRCTAAQHSCQFASWCHGLEWSERWHSGAPEPLRPDDEVSACRAGSVAACHGPSAQSVTCPRAGLLISRQKHSGGPEPLRLANGMPGKPDPFCPVADIPIHRSPSVQSMTPQNAVSSSRTLAPMVIMNPAARVRGSFT